MAKHADMTMPVIAEPLEDVTAFENTTAVFKCKVSGIPEFTSWFKDGVEIVSTDKINITKSDQWMRLKIAPVTTDDHGVYSVVCQNSGGAVFSAANLYVTPAKNTKTNFGIFQVAPFPYEIARIKKPLLPVRARLGEDFEIYVEITADVTNYHWYKSNRPLLFDKRINRIESKRISRVFIKNAKLSDTGIYFVLVYTGYCIVSSYTNVIVIDTDTVMNSQNQKLPLTIEEYLPDDLETNEMEETKLICKVVYQRHHRVRWYKDDIPLKDKRKIPEFYSDGYIGLRIMEPLLSDTGNYTVVLSDPATAHVESSSCFLTVNPYPMKNPPVLLLHRNLKSMIACVGSTISFDCSFGVKDPRYFYVVWKVGNYRVERTNSRFDVLYFGEEFLLNIKHVEQGMTGEVSCEIRRALPNRKSILIESTTSYLCVVPPIVIEEELYKQSYYNSKDRRYQRRYIEPYENFSSDSGNRSMIPKDVSEQRALCKPAPSGVALNEGIFIINYCSWHIITGTEPPILVDLPVQKCYRLDHDDYFYLDVVPGNFDDRDPPYIMVYERPHDPGTSRRLAPKVVVFKWDECLVSPRLWYNIEVKQTDGLYMRAGLSSLPLFDVVNPPIGQKITFRVTSESATDTTWESIISIAPAPTENTLSLIPFNLKSFEYFNMNYTKTGEIIGCGAFGSVILVHNCDGDYYAAKILKARTQKKKETAMREFEIMKLLKHPKLVELQDAFLAKDMFIFVMDYLWGGELFERIVEEDHIRECDVVRYIEQICEALEYLHSLRIAHLDLKPENIICLNPNSRQIKIVDFGLARVLEEGHLTRAIYGTKEYIAPEVLSFEPLTVACDMWSLGVVTYMLLSGIMPFAGETWAERSSNITMASFNYDDSVFDEISDSAKDFMNNLLVLPASIRLTASEALDHPWIIYGPPTEGRAGQMKQARKNLKSYLVNNRARWQRAGNVMIAAHRLRTHAARYRRLDAGSADGRPSTSRTVQ